MAKSDAYRPDIFDLGKRLIAQQSQTTFLLMKTYWLSFCDSHQKKGDQFFGVCIIDVTEADASAALLDIQERFPHASEGLASEADS